MDTFHQTIESHYTTPGILDIILQALKKMGKDLKRLEPQDLAPVDAIHIRGKEATIELAQRTSIEPGSHVLDVGCGLGGAARYLASQYQCRVTGIDLTQEFVDTARALAGLVGLQDKVDFRQASALDLPFEENSFDLAWTEHVQINIPDKEKFYGEIARTLKSGHKFIFHDIFQGDGGEIHFPVPWAREKSMSHLATPNKIKSILQKLGFKILDWEDKTPQSFQWFKGMTEQMEKSGPPVLGIHLLMGENALIKFKNLARNLGEGRVTIVQAVVEKAF